MKAEQAQAPEALKALIEAQLDDDKAEDVVSIDLAGKTTIADYMIVASGRSARQVGSMADHIIEKLKREGYGPVAAEGQEASDWVLIDAGDVIVHLFRPEVRDFYRIERMWLADDEIGAGRAAPPSEEQGGWRPLPTASLLH